MFPECHWLTLSGYREQDQMDSESGLDVKPTAAQLEGSQSEAGIPTTNKRGRAVIVKEEAKPNVAAQRPAVRVQPK
jgi:hypothetical protein